MSANYQKIVLGAEAKNYILKRLSDGNTLTRLLYKPLSGSCGEVMVAFPKGIAPANLDKFKDGGKLPADTSNTSHKQFFGQTLRMVPTPSFRDFLIETIESFLKEDSENICVFEDNLIKPEDSWIQPFKERFFFCGEETYHSIRGCIIKREEIESAVKLTRSWLPEAGILTNLDNLNADFLTGGATNMDCLKHLVKNTKKLFVEAYDHENFLIWDIK